MHHNVEHDRVAAASIKPIMVSLLYNEHPTWELAMASAKRRNPILGSYTPKMGVIT